MSTSYFVDQWINYWARTLESPRKVFFGMTTSNVIRVAVESLRQDLDRGMKSPSRRSKVLFTEISRAIQENGPVVSVLRDIQPEAYIRVSNQFASNRVAESGTMRSTLQLLQALCDGITPHDLVAVVIKGIQPSEDDYTADIAKCCAATQLLMEIAITSWSGKELKQFGRDKIARFATEALISRAASHKYSERAELSASVAECVELLITEGTAERIVELPNVDTSRVFDLFEGFEWNNRVYSAMFPRGMRGSDARDEAEVSLVGAIAMQNEEAQALLERFVRTYCVHVCYCILKDQMDTTSSAVRESVGSLSRMLSEQLGFNRLEEHPGNPNYQLDEAMDGATSIALVRSAASVIADRIVSQLDMSLLELQMGERLQSDLDTDDSELLIRAKLTTIDRVALRPVQKKLWALFNATLDDVVPGFRDACTYLLSTREAWEQSVTHAFVEEWEEKLPGYFEHHSRAYQNMPWDNFDHDELGFIFNSLAGEVRRAPNDWLVTLGVNGAISANTIWAAGDILFCDPEIVDYGSVEWALPVNTQTNWTLARVFVQAGTRMEAQHKATHAVETVLSAISFDTAAFVGAGGFRPKLISDGYFIRNLNHGNPWWGYSRHRSEIHVDEVVRDGGPLLSAARDHQILFEKSMRNIQSLTPLESGYLNSVRWYRLGRWEPDPTRRFLFYWLALESLFDSGKAMMDQLPELFETWFDLFDVSTLIALGSDIKRFFAVECDFSKSDSDAISGAIHVEIVDLLKESCTAKLLQLVPEERIDVRSKIEAFREQTQKVASNQHKINRKLIAVHQKNQFRLFNHQLTRHRMTHEAAGLSPFVHADIVADDLEEFLVIVLNKISRSINSSDQRASTMNELVNLYRFPWQGGHNPIRGMT